MRQEECFSDMMIHVSSLLRYHWPFTYIWEQALAALAREASVDRSFFPMRLLRCLGRRFRRPLLEASAGSSGAGIAAAVASSVMFHVAFERKFFSHALAQIDEV